MANQPVNPPQRPQRREDYKVEKLLKRIEVKQALQAIAMREAGQASAKN